MSAETWAETEEEAKLRASKYRDKDPYESVVPKALLSGGHISMYAERISLIYPAHGIGK